MVDALTGITDGFGAWLFSFRGFVMAADQETIAVYDGKIQDYAALKPEFNSLLEQGFWIMVAGPAPLLAPLQIKAFK